ncbi:MAG TPA: tRNA adenosine deaminase-associated protein [Actinocrinis sp.]|nr:tRNA adenosine deaminase-associated protein [Actinocrinis sp.]
MPDLEQPEGAEEYLPFTEDLVDFAVAAFLEDGRWAVVSLPPHTAESLEALLCALHQQVSEGPTLGLVGLGDEYFVLALLLGPQIRLFLSNQAVCGEDRLAGDLARRAGTRAGGGPTPCGDRDILAALGVDSLELALTCERLLAEPDLSLVEVVTPLAARIGFGEQFVLAVERDPALDDY